MDFIIRNVDILMGKYALLYQIFYLQDWVNSFYYCQYLIFRISYIKFQFFFSKYFYYYIQLFISNK